MKFLGQLGAKLAYGLASAVVGPFLDQRADLRYPKPATSLLNTLCDRFGSDKGEIVPAGHPYPWPSHTYADIYELLFQLKRKEVRAVFECGLGTNNPEVASSMGVDGRPGASLRVWRDFFPQAEIIGVDIDARVLFDEARIKTYQCDQTSPDSIAAMRAAASLRSFSLDIIIDDGLHKFAAGVCLLEHLIDCLAADGLYIIEDVNAKDYQRYVRYFATRGAAFSVKYFNLHRRKSWMATTAWW